MTTAPRSRVNSFGVPGPRGPTGPSGPQGPTGAGGDDGYRANAISEFSAAADGSTDDTSALNAALASGASHVFLPPGTYRVAGAVTASAADQTITLAPGAILAIENTGGVVFSGARQRINGLRVTLAIAAVTTFSAVVVAGASSVVRGAQFTVTADMANATLLQLAADDVVAYDVFIKADSRFFRGVSITKQDDSAPLRVVVQGLNTDIAPSTAKQLGSLVNSHGYAFIHNLSITTGGNVTFSEGVIRQRASGLELHNPQIFCSAAQYGVYGVDSASEKLIIFGGSIQGRNNGTFTAGSEGLRVGHQSGHQKVYGTFINGWENGVVFHGSADSPGFYSAIIANNQNYAFVIDAGTGVGAVRGLSVVNCYLSDVHQKFTLHCVSGKLEGWKFSGCELGFDDIAILVDSGFDGLEGGIVDGCFIQGGAHSATPLGVISPNVNASNTLFVNNKTQNIGALGTGTYASKAVDIFDPVMTGMTIGTTGTRMTRVWTTTAALSFPTSLNANEYEDKVATVTGVVAGDDVRVSVPDDVMYPGDSYFAWVSGSNFVTVRRKATGAFPSAASGTFRFTVTKY